MCSLQYVSKMMSSFGPVSQKAEKNRHISGIGNLKIRGRRKMIQVKDRNLPYTRSDVPKVKAVKVLYQQRQKRSRRRRVRIDIIV